MSCRNLACIGTESFARVEMSFPCKTLGHHLHQCEMLPHDFAFGGWPKSGEQIPI
ncbi:hypothetical protein DPMN_152532 [Dreissena polymorpha]|uniref:Uncharacterized protein n=1 Tax=Dreissena polymorpha TaxID=45954 RepID=A0A9D4FKK1_DREPO|nr:hypothetical protein DPMN_152532 [Dreissena polymorpha]